MVQFANIADLKKQPTEKAKLFPSGFPIPMGKQIAHGPRPLKLKFPKPDRIKK